MKNSALHHEDINKSSFQITGQGLTTKFVTKLARNSNICLEIDEETSHRITLSRKLLDKFVDSGRIIYGVNTSMGGFVNYLVPKAYASQMQYNLIAAVATNVGDYFPADVVRASILARLNSLARGASAISEINFLKLMQIYNANIIPCVPQKGSLGTSGDLGPLACIALVGVGQWKVRDGEEGVISGKDALDKASIEPMELSYKEGLALINGTSMMAGMAALIVEDAQLLLKTYEVITSMSFEALRAKIQPFDSRVHLQKPHKGQQSVARNISKLLRDSKLIESDEQVEEYLRHAMDSGIQSMDRSIEDAYSIRCTPQILGPVRDTLLFVQTTVENELNSSNDNPLIIPEYGEAFHNGHFHGQYISMAMDFLSIGLTTVCNLSDRRNDRCLDKNHSNGLPAFLCQQNPGLRLGLMGGQFMATALTAETRSLCTPLSTQSLPSTEDFQDIVSLGLAAARRAKEILKNTQYVIAFELICACQALDIRGISLASNSTQAVHKLIREHVPYSTTDEPLTDYLEAIVKLIANGEILSKAEFIVGELTD